ncbi:MAG: carboxypeptidase-like regulatory domain-containing protein, partial [Planctomycetota bacterium]
LEPATEDEYGMVLVDEDGPAWLSLIASHQVLASQRIDDETRSVEFVVEPEDLDGLKGSVGLVAVDAETGAPLVARVTVGRDAFPNGGVSGETSAETGEITLEGVDPGERWLIVQADGRATSKQQVRIERGARLDVGMVALRAPVEIAGFVRDAEGKAYEAVVKWGRLDDATGRVEWARQTRAQSTADGRFRISDLEPGVYAVQAPGLPARSPIPHNARLASRAVRVDATSGSVADVSLELRGTSKLTLVTGDLAEPWATAIAIDASGLPADSTWLGRWGPEIELDLVDGVYTLVVLRDGEEIEERKISIVGHDVRIELDL